MVGNNWTPADSRFRHISKIKTLMNTQNIISTPDIVGNIGSCKTEKVESKVHGGILQSEYKVVLTNSCTGQIVSDYNYTEFTFLSGFGIGLISLIVLAILFSAIND
jgi:hypothetical protein